jgi:DHA1 family bicyclomycin/chloramphenicol resistance-like MFS transporter
VFAAVTVVAAVALVLMGMFPETRPPQDRTRVSAAHVLRSFTRLLCDRHFLALTFIGGLGMASFFTFLASSSFIYIEHFGLTPTQFSLAFAVNAIGFIGASQFAAPLGTRYGMARMVTVAVSLYALFALILFALTAAGIDSLPVLIGLLFIAFAWLGLVIPSTMVLALEDHGPIAGMASALGGTLQMVAGGIVIVIVSLCFDGTALPMVATIAVCAVGALILSLAALSGRRMAPQPAE